MRVWTVIGLLAIVGLVTADVLLRGPLTRLDWTIHLWVDDHSEGALWWFFKVLSLSGQRGVVAVPLGVLSIVLSIRQRSIRPVLAAFLVCIVLAIVVPAFKIATGRTAPGAGYDAVFAGGAEYPSGHAVNGIVLWGMTFEYAWALGGRFGAWFTTPRRRWLTAYTGISAGIGMTGLDYHWLSDVLAGWPLGLAFFIVVLACLPAAAPPLRRSGTCVGSRSELGEDEPGARLWREPRALARHLEPGEVDRDEVVHPDRGDEQR